MAQKILFQWLFGLPSDFSSQHNSVDEQEKADLDFGEPLFKAQNYSTCPDISRKGARNVRLTSFFLDNFLRLFKQVFPSAGGFAAHAVRLSGVFTNAYLS